MHTEEVIAWLERFKVPIKAIRANQTLKWEDGILYAACFQFGEDGRKIMSPDGQNFHVSGRAFSDVGEPPKHIQTRVGV